MYAGRQAGRQADEQMPGWIFKNRVRGWGLLLFAPGLVQIEILSLAFFPVGLSSFDAPLALFPLELHSL